MRQFIKQLLSKRKIDRLDRFADPMLLKNDSMTSLDPEVHWLQSIFTSFELSHALYVEVLAFFATKLAACEAERSLENCLCSCLQFLVSYSICVFDKEWTL